MMNERSRAGRYVRQPLGYRAFVPSSLPPRPPLVIDAELTNHLSEADRALGRLDGVASVLPNPNLFVAMYVNHEAVLSSQIEGTQSTLEDVLSYEFEEGRARLPHDVEEVVNYVAAMNYGLSRLSELPLSLRLVREMHGILLQGVRGGNSLPGEFRTSQNFIGAKGANLVDAEFVPPPPVELQQALSDFERFLHDSQSYPALIHAALCHAQFETIHPFNDGNGRVGRLLITLLLCERKILIKPLLYLSYYLKAHRSQYYDRLMAIRNDGDWEGWVKFFLRGIFEVSQAATETARAILDLRELDRAKVVKMSSSSRALQLLDQLYQTPVVTVRSVESILGVAYATASKLVKGFVRQGILIEITSQRRYRIYRYETYVELFNRQQLRANLQAQ